jgi:hypothetical protein
VASVYLRKKVSNDLTAGSIEVKIFQLDRTKRVNRGIQTSPAPDKEDKDFSTIRSSEGKVSQRTYLMIHRDILEFQDNVTIQIRVEGGCLLNPVFNFHLAEERGRRRRHRKEREDGQSKRQRV